MTSIGPGGKVSRTSPRNCICLTRVDTKLSTKVGPEGRETREDLERRLCYRDLQRQIIMLQPSRLLHFRPTEQAPRMGLFGAGDAPLPMLAEGADNLLVACLLVGYPKLCLTILHNNGEARNILDKIVEILRRLFHIHSRTTKRHHTSLVAYRQAKAPKFSRPSLAMPLLVRRYLRA